MSGIKISLHVDYDNYNEESELILQTNDIDDNKIHLTLKATNSERSIQVNKHELLKSLKLLIEG